MLTFTLVVICLIGEAVIILWLSVDSASLVGLVKTINDLEAKVEDLEDKIELQVKN